MGTPISEGNKATVTMRWSCALYWPESASGGRSTSLRVHQLDSASG